ncbi:hypothetical protein ASY01nite_06050 [Acetobacter syzygii]|uniref:hypothetical protein n=1 Tax=Acetobacter syzygii TaxID=146476 RepID=UPI0005DC4CCF|nr:hypothetical protein [Acetobacter syzygii]GAN70572.1 hypothetical protein Absy_008_085 [Acetobacter syzygii]GBR65784.1 hypothetical protein AA0483_2018 [Acetobacter syzygii NRIC 0483]GEL55539.1 hypothetical protein ASY01nite_06050 [Acetobacter syzygii]
MSNGDNAFGTLAEPNQTILVQGLNVASLKCETDTPIAIGGTVRNAQLQAPVVDILESGVVAGELVADEVVIRGAAENVVIRAKRFYATGTAKIRNCTLFLEGVSGCSIHHTAELTGDFRIATGSFAPAAAAPAAPASVAPAAAPTPAKTVKVEVKSSPAPAPAAPVAKPAPVEAAKPATPESSVWGDVDQVMRSVAETEDGHASLMGTAEAQP